MTFCGASNVFIGDGKWAVKSSQTEEKVPKKKKDPKDAQIEALTKKVEALELKLKTLDGTLPGKKSTQGKKVGPVDVQPATAATAKKVAKTAKSSKNSIGYVSSWGDSNGLNF